MKAKVYRYSLALTSQFYYCGLPIRLDSYSTCQFNCLYCFASARGGYRGPEKLETIDVSSLERRLERTNQGLARSVIDEFLQRRQPVHFGGMSDPFLPAEERLRATYETLKQLTTHGYPTVVSTKGKLLARDEYLELLTRSNFVVQVSLSTLDNKLTASMDIGTPTASERLRVIEKLAAAGVFVTCRIQPLLPGREAEAAEIVDACRETGVKHVAVEHLKLPVEASWWGTARLGNLLGLDLYTHYSRRGAVRVGREFVLPLRDRLDVVLSLRERAHTLGLTFGAADNDLLLLTDGDCCCSGVDFAPGFGGFFRHTYTEAVRRGLAANRIGLGLLEDVWVPRRSVAQYVNSHSRVKRDGESGASLDKYIRRSWNGSTNGNSPLALFGVRDSGEVDEHGYRVYAVDDALRTLLRDRRAPVIAGK